MVKYYKNESQFYATFLNGQGKPIANNTEVHFNVNGVFYTSYTNENGTAKLNINLYPGNYIITSMHPDGFQMGVNIFVNKTLITYDISQPCNKTGTATFNAEVLDGSWIGPPSAGMTGGILPLSITGSGENSNARSTRVWSQMRHIVSRPAARPPAAAVQARPPAFRSSAA